jgi:hypothetical protein
MPGFESNQTSIDNTVENRRLGSIMLTLGWILLWFDAMLVVYLYSSVRDGSMFWPTWVAIQGIIGLGLVIMGTRYRRVIGATRLGQRDMAGIERDQRREEEEQRHVA